MAKVRKLELKKISSLHKDFKWCVGMNIDHFSFRMFKKLEGKKKNNEGRQEVNTVACPSNSSKNESTGKSL